MSKFVLDNQLVADTFFEDASLLGIMAPMPGYQFCNLLKLSMGFGFRNEPTSEICLTRKNRKYYFSVFRYSETTSNTEHFIYNNKYDGEYLLPEFKHLDFAWLIQGTRADPLQVPQLTQTLKQIAGVQLIVELTNEKIKNKQHLIL